MGEIHSLGSLTRSHLNLWIDGESLPDEHSSVTHNYFQSAWISDVVLWGIQSRSYFFSRREYDKKKKKRERKPAKIIYLQQRKITVITFKSNVFSETVSYLFWIIHRPCCEQFSLEPFSTREIVPMKTAKSLDLAQPGCKKTKQNQLHLLENKYIL